MEKVRPIKTETFFWSPNLSAEINAMQRTKPLRKSSLLNMIYVVTVEGHHTDFAKLTLQIDLGSLKLKMSPMGDLLGYFYGSLKFSPS